MNHTNNSAYHACINNKVEELHSDVWNQIAAVLDLTDHQFHNIRVTIGYY